MQILPTQTVSDTQCSENISQLKACMHQSVSLFADSFASSLDRAQAELFPAEQAEEGKDREEAGDSENENTAAADTTAPDAENSQCVLESAVSFLQFFGASGQAKNAKSQSLAPRGQHKVEAQKNAENGGDEQATAAKLQIKDTEPRVEERAIRLEEKDQKARTAATEQTRHEKRLGEDLRLEVEKRESVRDARAEQKARLDQVDFDRKWHKDEDIPSAQMLKQEEPSTASHNDLHPNHSPFMHSVREDMGSKGSGQGKAGDGQSEKNGWKELLGKVRLDPKTVGTSSSGNFQSTLAQGPQQAGFEPLSQTPAQNSPISRQVASQVENGLFSSLKSGGSRLELQLHPQELGSVAITLVSRNGEVSAHIRADNAETVDMLNQQAEIIKQNLEDQGIKIDKIEIELREQDAQADADRLLQDMENHNSFQEEGARREHLRRLRNLASVSGHNQNSRHEDHEIKAPGGDGSRMLDRVA